jgi:hypothetical protein
VELLNYNSFEYIGDVVYLDMMGTPFLIINSVEDAEELANKRSNNYSDRPFHMIIGEL